MSRRNTAGVTDYLQPNGTSGRHPSAIEHFDATYHDGEIESRRRGDVEPEERGLSVEKVCCEFEPGHVV